MSGRHRIASKTPLRLLRVGAAAIALFASIGLEAGGAHPSQAVVPPNSAVTVSGAGEFANLKVTISQTRNLLDQVEQISWTGGVPTEPNSGSFGRNYLQIMQCWGKDPSGPKREQCQFGGLVGDGRGGAWATSRQVTYGRQLVDPAETYKAPPNSLDTVNVPFQSVTGKTVTAGLNEFYDAASTNEIPFGRTRADGTGQEYFEVQTAREAPGLGCGTAEKTSTGSVTGQPCWLVVVPRSNKEVDGSVVTQSDQLRSSPLSASNWAHRIVVPLQFAPIGAACTIGKAERPTVGQETIAEAMTHWQPKLCEVTPAIYGYSQTGDAVARRQLVTPTPGLAFVSKPLPANQANPAGPAVYAPAAVSGLTFAFNIESQSSGLAPTAIKINNGIRIPELNLTARLVAKLLTQSYRFAVGYSAADVQDNPSDMTRDPDFLQYNPTFKPLFFSGIDDVLAPIGLADTTSQVWNWLKSDPEASAFLAGKPDPWGMRINPNYKNLDIPRDDFPKTDPYCATFDGGQPPLCVFDSHPYAADLHGAARAASRGDSLSRAVWDPTAVPPAYKTAPLQLSGTRSLIAFTDTPTALRYNLPVARIRNAAGKFVAPTTESLLAGVAAMTQSSTPGVLVPNPATKTSDAYPLATVSYAVTIPNALTAAARADYATLLRYIAGPGQVQGYDDGELPFGYAPLPASMAAMTLRTAGAVLHPTTTSSDATPPTATTPSRGGKTGVPLAPTAVGGSSGSATSNSGIPVVPTAAPTAPAPQPQVARAFEAGSEFSGVNPGLARYLLVIALVLGAATVVAGPSLHVLTRRKAGQPTS